MKYVSAFTPCKQNRSSEWHVNTAPDGSLYAVFGNHNLFLPFHSMWTGDNHYDTNCLSANELSLLQQQNRKAGWPQPIINETFDAYQMDFWSNGTHFNNGALS